MVEICNNHPMFQFLFEESGKLLAANKRAMYNMKGMYADRTGNTNGVLKTMSSVLERARAADTAHHWSTM